MTDSVATGRRPLGLYPGCPEPGITVVGPRKRTFIGFGVSFCSINGGIRSN